MTTAPIQTSLYIPLETIQTTPAINKYISPDFFQKVHLPSFPSPLFTLKDRVKDLKEMVQMAQNSRKYEFMWKVIKILACAVMVGAIAGFLYKLSQLSWQTITPLIAFKNAASGLVIVGLLWLGYKSVTTLQKDEIEAIKEVVEFLGHNNKFPTLAGIVGATKVEAFEKQAKAKDGDLRKEILDCKDYFNANYKKIDDALCKQINNNTGSPVKEINQIIDQLSNVRKELKAINDKLLSIQIKG